ncbi:hypothetical protein ElyMa_000217500 [Elysia marginata]|uniref:Endonuclease/exonuclease/phosphatase domain-containing protein n=1 Tax=Elysia marginata TaxID=1093978 RepID=A0AAV4EZT1_9GAST|nr:hypothetical protein ElyMa_000217500 [Elysia marginata]
MFGDQSYPPHNLPLYNMHSVFTPDKDFHFEPKMKQDNFIMLGDLNSHLPSWGYDTLDSKGENMEDWVINNQLIIPDWADYPLVFPVFTSFTWRTSSTSTIIKKGRKELLREPAGGSGYKPSIITKQM